MLFSYISNRSNEILLFIFLLQPLFVVSELLLQSFDSLLLIYYNLLRLLPCLFGSLILFIQLPVLLLDINILLMILLGF